MRLILDPDLFEFSGGSDMEEAEYLTMLEDTVTFAKEQFQEPFLDSYDGAPYCCYIGPPYANAVIFQGLFSEANYAQIVSDILSLMDGRDWIDVSGEKPAQCGALSLDANSILSRPFLQYLAWLVPNQNHGDIPSLLLLGHANRTQFPKVTVTAETGSRTLETLYCPATDCHHVVAAFLGAPLNHDDMFPRRDACRALNDAFKAEPRGNPNYNLALFIRYAEEAAQRNGYSKHKALTQKNTSQNHKRIVFGHPQGDYYLSADLESGGFEVFDAHTKVTCRQGRSYKHLGEYNYCGELTDDPDTNGHPLFV